MSYRAPLTKMFSTAPLNPSPKKLLCTNIQRKLKNSTKTTLFPLKELSHEIDLAFEDMHGQVYTVKIAVELLDVPSRNTSLMLKKHNSNVEFFGLSTYVLFFPLCYQMKKFDFRAV